MKIINHWASEGKPRTAGQVLNRATSRAICFRASKRTWACLKKLVLRWETPSYGHLISSTGVPGTSQGQSRTRVDQMTRSTWQGSTVLSGNTVQSQDSAARSRVTALIVEGHTPAPSQQGSVTTFRHSPSQHSVEQEAEKWNQSNLKLFTLLNLTGIYRARYFLR